MDFTTVFDSLKLEQVKLDSMLKACEKAVEAVERLESVPDRLRASIEKLCQTQEAGERMKAELAFTIKFKKSLSTGIPLTFESVSAHLELVIGLREDLEADARVCKAHMPLMARKAKMS